VGCVWRWTEWGHSARGDWLLNLTQPWNRKERGQKGVEFRGTASILGKRRRFVGGAVMEGRMTIFLASRTARLCDRWEGINRETLL
jgi:hypothetical protein